MASGCRWAPRRSSIRAVNRLRRHLWALTFFVLSVVLLASSVARSEPQVLLQAPSTPVTPSAVASSPEVSSPDSDLSEVVVQAPEPRFAAPTMRDRIGRIWAPVMINGRGPYRLVLDTGATHSAIVPQVADSLGIAVGDYSVVRVTGVTGSAVVPMISVDRMQMGELFMSPSTLPVVPDVFGGAQGVLGTEGLSDKRILIDFAHDTVVIRRSRGELDRAGLTTLPLRQLRDRLLALDVLVGDVHVKAVIDTGAQVSIGNLALREALVRRHFQDMKKAEIEGVTLDVVYGDMMRAPPISMGSLTLHGVNITYGDMYIFERWKLNGQPVLVLGMDVLGSVDELIIDYRLRQLQLRTRHS